MSALKHAFMALILCGIAVMAVKFMATPAVGSGVRDSGPGVAPLVAPAVPSAGGLLSSGGVDSSSSAQRLLVGSGAAGQLAEKYKLRRAIDVLGAEELAAIYEAVAAPLDKFTKQLTSLRAAWPDLQSAPWEVTCEICSLEKVVIEREMQLQLLESAACLVGPAEVFASNYSSMVNEVGACNIVLMNKQHTPQSGQVVFVLDRNGRYLDAINRHFDAVKARRPNEKEPK